MTMVGRPWPPNCLHLAKTANVSMEATTENFMKLFEFVNDQRMENIGKLPEARTPTCATPKKRTVRP